MRAVILLVAWATPALMAGALGWPGTWGGSALADFLIPIPVAGGTMHVPSFVVLSVMVLASRPNESRQSFLPIVAFAVCAGAVAAMIDFERLNGWLFTDYVPHGSPLRLEGDALFLFFATDAFWAGVNALRTGARSPGWSWLILAAVPLVVIAAMAVGYRAGGPVFDIGPGRPGPARGEELQFVYTSAPYDEDVFRAWVDAKVLPPWESVNAEHTTVVFSSSLHDLKWGALEVSDDDVVATTCLFEEDRSVVTHRGAHDCFAERETVAETLDRLTASESTGLGADIDRWYALAVFCDGVVAVEGPTDIESIGVCRGLVNGYPRAVARFVQRYGNPSVQAEFVRAEGRARGLAGP